MIFTIFTKSKLNHNLIPFPVAYLMSKRYYPGGPKLLELRETKVLLQKGAEVMGYYNFTAHTKPFKFNTPYQKQHHDNIFECKDGSVIAYNSTKDSFWVFIKKTLSNTKQITNIPKNRIDLSQKNKVQRIGSGVMNLPPEYYTKGFKYQQEFNKVIIIIYGKVLYTLGKYNIHNDLALFEHIDKLFPSISKLYENMEYYDKWNELTMPSTQHVLRALFLDKMFPRDYFEKYLENDVDFTQYKIGDILLLIESFVFKHTISRVRKSISFTAMNPDIPEEQRPGYSKQTCKEVTVQENADFQGTQMLVLPDGDIQCNITYKDVKTFESNAHQGRLALSANLYTNIQRIREYSTKYESILKETIDKKGIKKILRILFMYYIGIFKHKK